ncbi:MAG: transglutaminase domain-containing protein [Alkalispirochaeta sp.]
MEGRGFGDSGRLAVDRTPIGREHIRRWTPNLILFDVPEEATSGSLRVTTSGGTSNAVFVTAEEDIPVRPRDHEVEVTSITPETADIGSPVVVEGYGFGPRSALAELAFIGAESSYNVSADHDVVLEWSNRRIEIVLPHELTSQAYRIAINQHPTDARLQVSPPGGEAVYGEQRQFAVRTAMTVSTPSEELIVVMPRGMTLPEQPEVQLIRENVPSRPGHSGPAALYEVPPAEEVQRIDRVVLVARQTVQWDISEGRQSEILLEPWFRTAYRRFLSAAEDVPRDHAVVTELRRGLQLREPVLEIARAVHASVISALEPDRTGTADAIRAIETEEAAGAYAYATLATALARSAGVPARRHFGVLLDDGGRSVPHAWVEFLVPGVGWIPADPAVDDGMLDDDFSSLAQFYDEVAEQGTFGTLDNRRVTLSMDGHRSPRVYPAGSTRGPDENWAPGILRTEYSGSIFPDDVQYQWQPPTLFGWFD